jgi:ribosomal protein L37AE/L43A
MTDENECGCKGERTGHFLCAVNDIMAKEQAARVCTKCNQEIHHNWFPSTFCWRCDTTSRMPRSGSALPDEIQARNKQIETGECQHLNYSQDMDGDYCLDCGLHETDLDEGEEE